ncbi:MAG: archease [Promethearchaeota archaeon]
MSWFFITILYGFKFLDHTADIQSLSWGRNLEEAFSQSALSLMTVISPDLERVSQNITKKIKITSEDKESLLFDFLSEFLYIFDVEELIFGNINVLSIKKKENQYHLNATVKGEKFNKNTHEIGTEVKAITYSFIEITENKDRIEIKVTFDL